MRVRLGARVRTHIIGLGYIHTSGLDYYQVKHIGCEAAGLGDERLGPSAYWAEGCTHWLDAVHRG